MDAQVLMSRGQTHEVVKLGSPVVSFQPFRVPRSFVKLSKKKKATLDLEPWNLSLSKPTLAVIWLLGYQGSKAVLLSPARV